MTTPLKCLYLDSEMSLSNEYMFDVLWETKPPWELGNRTANIRNLMHTLEPHLKSTNKEVTSKNYEHPMNPFEKDLLTIMLKNICYDWVLAKAELILRFYHSRTSTKCACCRLLSLLIKTKTLNPTVTSTTAKGKSLATHFYLKPLVSQM